jgi:Ran GTPase-activating protein (RanGAP) involved in mRNA processing and transport
VQAGGSLPKPMSFMTGHSRSFEAPDEGLNDHDLQPVIDMMDDIPINNVNLEGNLLLSEKALVKFSHKLCDTPEALAHLNFKRCINAGALVADILIGLIANVTTGCNMLRFLDLSGIPIGSRRFLPLTKAVGKHPRLHEVRLADTGLGGDHVPTECIEHIVESQTIEILDVGWNCFDETEFSVLGECLTESNRLKKLIISNCSAAGKVGHATPIVFFIEHLSRCTALRQLDISLNRIDFRGALVIEDSLEDCMSLTQLDVSHNPLGYLGMRNLLRLLVRATSGLLNFTCEECSTGKAQDASEIFQVFSCNSPGGRYTLELARPYHRSILRMLYKTCEKYKLEPSFGFTHLSGNPPYSHPTKSAGVWAVPTKGTLATTFSIDKAVESALQNIDVWNFAAFSDKYTTLMRVKPAFHKVIPLLAQWRNLDGRATEQRCLLKALAGDFELTYPQIVCMSQSRSMLQEIISCMLPSIEGGQVTRYLTMLLIPSLGEYVNTLRKQRNLLAFNVDNPNGHYCLDLENPSDHAVAERLLVLDRWETSIALKLKRVDTSQRGNYSQIRNEMYQDRPLRCSSLQEWNMPESDKLQFDYSSGKRPPPTAAPIDDTTFSNILVSLQNSDCEAHDQIEALQMASHMFYICSKQLRGLLGVYANRDSRLELFILLFLRVVDFYNEKIFRVRFDDEQELITLSNRIGWVTVFPFIQPEQATFKLDFSVYDERLSANIILALSGKEVKNNLRDPQYIRPDGTEDPLTLGIPRSWESFEKMPTGGHFTVSYVCSPEDRNYAARRSLYETYGYRVGVPEDEVMWWAALNAAPEDVVEYLAFITAKCGSVQAAFLEIDGEGGNGVISLREFEEGYAEMGCQKFKGPGEKERVRGIFRYLDPSGEGQVSSDEFNMLELLWQEIKLSITEFVQFCERTFGDDLQATWVFMDDDGGGEIDLQEWVDACQKVGFFGPVVPIFGYLDEDDEGSVSIDEFMLLEDFQEAPENRHNAKMSRPTQR